MNEIRKILYTAEATLEGDREGSGRTNDDRLAVELDVPTEMGGSGGPGTYSRATRGNISVELMIGGQPIAETANVA